MGRAVESHSAWLGALELGERWAAWRGVVGDAVVHRHLAAQAVVAAAPVRIFDAAGRAARGRCILIDPFAPHRLEPGGEAELLFVEPAGVFPVEIAARLVAAAAEGPVVLVSAGGRRFWAHAREPTSSTGDARDACVARGLAAVDGAIARGPVRLATAAGAAGLSPSRFRHLLVERLGVTHRRYVLWRRLRLAAAALSAGLSVTEAAHASGFADAAHFARTLKATFGVTAARALLSPSPAGPAPAFKRPARGRS